MESFTAWFAQNAASNMATDVPVLLAAGTASEAVCESRLVWLARLGGGAAGFRIYADHDGSLVYEEAFVAC